MSFARRIELYHNSVSFSCSPDPRAQRSDARISCWRPHRDARLAPMAGSLKAPCFARRARHKSWCTERARSGSSIIRVTIRQTTKGTVMLGSIFTSAGKSPGFDYGVRARRPASSDREPLGAVRMFPAG